MLNEPIPMDLSEECRLLGACLLKAQQVEFTLYGLVSHFSQSPEAQNDKRFKNLNPETFLRGDPRKLKATLGQLEGIFGAKLMISSDELKTFINDRNVIIHNYLRLTKANIRDAEKLSNPEQFLRNFLEQCNYWTRVMNGLSYTLLLQAAGKENRMNELNINKEQLRDLKEYIFHIEKFLNSKSG